MIRTALTPYEHSIFQRTEEVLACAEHFALSRAATRTQRQLLGKALLGLRAQLSEQQTPTPFIHMPLNVYVGLRGYDEAAIPLAAATTLLFLGIDICDDLADADLPAHWAGYRPAEINLAGATLLCALPQLAIAELDVPPACRDAMQRTLATGLLRMAAGQQTDLSLAGSGRVRVAEVEASVVAKSGEECALFAALAAQLAGAPRESVTLYTDLGRAIGTAAQLASDCYDLFDAPQSRDLANGTRTLPVALYLERQADGERATFLDLLSQAKGNMIAQETVRQRLRMAGALRHCTFVVEVYCQRALRTLAQIKPYEPGASGLRLMIDSISFFAKGAAR